MIDATIARGRLQDLARLGRSRLGRACSAAPLEPSAARRQPAADASSIAGDLPPRPRAASSRPATDDLVASTIR